MLAFLTGLHVLVSITLVLLVLVQDSKGDAMGALGGGGSGGSNSVFGATGATSFLAKATRYTAVAFAATSILLALNTTTRESSVTDNYIAPAAATLPTPEKSEADATAPAEPKAEAPAKEDGESK